MVACPHHLHRAKIFGKLEKSPMVGRSCRSSGCLIQITLGIGRLRARGRQAGTAKGMIFAFSEAVFPGDRSGGKGLRARTVVLLTIIHYLRPRKGS